MISVTQIQRHFALGRFDQLLDAVASNGMALPMALRVRLSVSDAASVAIGLSRVTELTYGPSPLSRAMAGYLVEQQQRDGSWDSDPLVTAVVLAALIKVSSDHFAGDTATGNAIGRGLAALAAFQADDGLFRSPLDRSREDRALVAGYMLLLLADCDHFRASIRFADLMTWFEANEHHLDDTTDRLWRMARMGTPAAARESVWDHAPVAA